MAEVITPPSICQVDGPVLFLAGPIQGAPDWHTHAIALLQDQAGLHIASPRRTSDAEALYDQQVKWEHHYLEQAGAGGVILFWLAREAIHFCDRAYAQTSRFELGEAVTLHRWQGIKLVVGIEEGFSNARYLRRTIAGKAPQVPLCASLCETCTAALALLAD